MCRPSWGGSTPAASSTPCRGPGAPRRGHPPGPRTDAGSEATSDRRNPGARRRQMLARASHLGGMRFRTPAGGAIIEDLCEVEEDACLREL